MMPPALPLLSRGTAFIISRLLGEAKMPKPAPHSTSRHMMLGARGVGRQQRRQHQARRHEGETDGAQDARVMAVGQAAGDGRDAGQR